MIKIGIIPIGHSDYINSMSSGIMDQAVSNLRQSGITVICSQKTATDSKSARLACRDILKQDVHGVIIFLCTWMESPVAMSAVREIEHLPFLLWGTPMFEHKGTLESTGSFVAYSMFKGSLDRLSYSYESVAGMPDDSVTLDKVLVFCRTAYAVEKLKRSSICLIGYSSMGIYPGTFDHLLMRKFIGPEVDQMDTYSLINRMKQVPDTSRKAAIEQLCSIARIKDDVSQTDLETVANMFVALKDLCLEKDYEAINIKCQYELSKEFGMTACVPLSLLAENDVVTSCEGDIPVTVSMLILKYLSATIPAYADIINISRDGTIKLSPCGMIPFSLGNPQERLIRQFMPGFGFKGIQNSFVFKPGVVTIMRLSEEIGKYRIVYALARGIPTQLRQGYMPALDIKTDIDITTLIENIGGQHYAFCYGDQSALIQGLSRMMGIRCIRV